MVLCQTIRRTPPSWFAGAIGRCVCESEQCSGTGGRIPGGHFQGVAVFVVVRRPSPFFVFSFFVFSCLLELCFVRRFCRKFIWDKNFVALLDSGFQISDLTLPQIARSAPSPCRCVCRACLRHKSRSHLVRPPVPSRPSRPVPSRPAPSRPVPSRRFPYVWTT